jgi:PAS domain S-box-containing protein
MSEINQFQNSEQRLALHLDQTPLAVIDWDREFRVISWNKAAERIFGYSSKEVIGRNPAELINPEEIKEEVGGIGIRLLQNSGSTRSSNENIRKDGIIIYCEWYNTSIVDNKGQVVGISSLVMDITERKKEQDLLLAKDSLLKAFTRALPDVSFIYDEDGRYVEILASNIELLYAQSEEMMGKTLYEIFPEKFARELHKVIKQTIDSGKPQIYEYKIELSTGETWFEARTSPMETKVNGKNTVVWLAHDITASKKSEKKVQELLLEKELILKEVHHRIKNNMHVIASLLTLQASKLNDIESIKSLQDAISRIHSMGTLYDKLYKSEIYQSVSIRDYLSQLIDEVMEIFSQVIEIKIEKQIDDIKLDPKILFPVGIIINELITNTMKYAFNGQNSGYAG